MEIRKLDNGSLHITGYVNITDKPSRVLRDRKGDSFVERVEPRCFTRALNTGDNVKFLLNHNHNIHLGSLEEGNLKLIEDNIGLKIDATVDNAEVRKAYDDGGFSGFSYGFQSLKDNFREWDNGVQLRTLQDIKLIEVSLLDSKTTPAYFGCMVNVEHRDEDAIETEIRTFSTELEVDEVKVEIEEVSEEVQQVNSEDDVEEEVNVDDEQSQEEQRLFSYNHKHYVDTFLRLSKEKGQY